MPGLFAFFRDLLLPAHACQIPQLGEPQRLFASQVLGGGSDTQQGRQYDVAADGRFLVNTLRTNDTPGPITLIQNWNPEATQ
jgi:hypothetical protein